MTTAEQGRQIAALGDAVGSFVAVRPDLAPQLLGAAYDDERQWLDPAMQTHSPAPLEPPSDALTQPERLTLRATHSHRP